MRTRLIATVATAATLAMLAGATTTASAAQAPTASKTPSGTVKLWGWGSPVEQALMKKIIAGFQKANPKIKVDYRVIEGDFTAAMTAAFAAKNPPDVFYVDSPISQDWMKQGLLEPLNGYAKSTKYDMSRFFPSLLKTFSVGKTVYGIPKDWSPLATVTNKALVEDKGISVPKTWDELKALGSKITVPDGRPVCLSPDWARWLPFVFQNGGSFLNSTGKNVVINSTAAKQAFQFWVDLSKAKIVGTPAELGVGWCGEAIGKGKAAIAFEGNWIVPFLTTTFPDVKFGLYPFIQGKQRANMGFTVAYSMAADSKNKPAAWKLLSYLVGKKGMGDWVATGSALPSRDDVKAVAGRNVFLAEAKYARGWSLTPKFSTVSDTANNDLTAVLAGRMTVDQMLADVQMAAESALGA